MFLRRLRRSPVAFWVTAIALALVTALVVGRTVARAESNRERYGSLRQVAVATERLGAGHVIRASDMQLRRLPTALVPAGALSSVPIGRTVVIPLFPNEPVLKQKLAPWGRTGVAALLSPGTRAVTVPAGPAPAPVRRGDVVDVLASFDSVAPDEEPTFAVAVAATVVAVGEDTVTVAVPEADAPRVAFAATAGVVTLAVRAGP